MVKLLVNNTEQVQPDDRNDTLIKLFCRRADDPSERIPLTVYGFDPYFFAPLEEVVGREEELLQNESIEAIDVDGEYESLKGRSLAKIYPPYPQDTRDARALFDEHYAADVQFTNRFRVDTGTRAVIEVPDGHLDSGEWAVHYREIKAVEPPS